MASRYTDCGTPAPYGVSIYWLKETKAITYFVFMGKERQNVYSIGIDLDIVIWGI
jgi:hypothetical protein